MMERPWQLAGIAGILFVVLFVVGIAIQGDVPTYDEGGEAIASWFADNSDEYLIGDFITGIGFLLYFPFLAALYARLRAAEAGPAIWSRVALLGGLLFPVAGLAGGIALAGLALQEGDVSSEVASVAAAGAFYGFGSAGFIAALLLIGASIVILTTHAFWTWLGWLGAVLGIVAIIAGASPIENDPEGVLSILGFIAFIGLGVWILAVSVALLQTREPASGEAAM